MNSSRVIGASGLVLSVMLILAGSNVEYGAKAYRFPNIIAYIMSGFSVIMLVAEGNGFARRKGVYFDSFGETLGKLKWLDMLRSSDFIRLLPMFIVLFLYLYLADIVGLYICSFVTFLSIVTLYTPVKLTVKVFIKYIFVSVVFTGVIYMIFSVGLQLRPPPAYLF